MPALPDVVGGYTARRNPQLGSGVAINLYPELQPPDTELQPTRRVAMLPTHGFTPFATTPSRVSGLSGSRERKERLLAASGRVLRVYPEPRPEDRGLATAHEVTPVLGAAFVAPDYYVVCRDGLVRRNAVAEPVNVEALVGLTPLGLATRVDGGVRRFWMSCVEDGLVRCWMLDGVNWDRDDDYDLDTVPVGVACPESLSWGVDPAGRPFLVCVDAIGGRLYEWRYDFTQPEPFTLVSRTGPQNAFDLQLLTGDSSQDLPLRGARPVLPGGVDAASNNQFITVLDAGTRQRRAFDRAAGILASTFADGALPSGLRAPYAFVSGAAPAAYYFPGDTAGTIRRSAGAVVRQVAGAPWKQPPRTPVVPFGDHGRLAGWVVDRRLHLLDLQHADEQDRGLYRNVAGPVDSLVFAGERFVGVDVQGGLLKASDPDQVVTPAASGLRYGAPAAAATVYPPLRGIPPAADDRRRMRGFFVGARVILGVTGEMDGNLWVWDRFDLDTPPRRINGATPVYGVCIEGGGNRAGECVLLVGRGTNQANVQFARYAHPPETEADFASTGGSVLRTNITLATPHTRRTVTDIASDGEFLYAVAGGGNVSVGGRAYSLTSGAAEPDRYFAEQVQVEGLTVAQGTGWLRAVDFVDGRLLLAIQQNAPNPTVIRAFVFEGGGWVRDGGRDIPTGASTDSVSLTHDAKFLYDLLHDPAAATLDDGTPVERSALPAFWLENPERLSRYRWQGDATTDYPALALQEFRGRLVTWTETEMTLWSAAQAPWPWSVAARRAVGIAAVDSPSVVDDMLFWIGKSKSGGVSAWMIGQDGDLNTQRIRQPAVDEIFDGAGSDVRGAVGWSDGFGSHSFYVLAIPGFGVSLAYDTGPDNKGAWHLRTSRMLADDDSPAGWWLNPRDDAERVQRVQRVLYATTWGDQQVCGGWGANGGILAFASDRTFADIDGLDVTRVRAFLGANPERRLARSPFLKIDCAYGVGEPDEDPEFGLYVSDDGGVTYHLTPRKRKFGVLGVSTRGGPAAFYRLGMSKFRVYRVAYTGDVEFILMSAYAAPANVRVAQTV